MRRLAAKHNPLRVWVKAGMLLAQPLSLVFICLAFSFVFRSAALWWVGAAFAVLVMVSPVLAVALYRSLALRYPSVLHPDPAMSDIVVLSANALEPGNDLPVNARMSLESSVRFLEGVRLQRAIPGSRLLVSVGDQLDPAGADRALDEVAELYGLDRPQLVAVAGGVNTRSEAALLRNHAIANPFYLVTSDYHMPRAMMIFRQAGLAPVAAPLVNAKLAGCGGAFGPLDLLPNSGCLQLFDKAFREYADILRIKIGGRTGP
jgi:uncharacterized SAM-binding protein YcdF (DUF218 family)